MLIACVSDDGNSKRRNIVELADCGDEKATTRKAAETLLFRDFGFASFMPRQKANAP